MEGLCSHRYKDILAVLVSSVLSAAVASFADRVDDRDGIELGEIVIPDDEKGNRSRMGSTFSVVGLVSHPFWRRTPTRKGSRSPKQVASEGKPINLSRKDVRRGNRPSHGSENAPRANEKPRNGFFFGSEYKGEGESESEGEGEGEGEGEVRYGDDDGVKLKKPRATACGGEGAYTAERRPSKIVVDSRQDGHGSGGRKAGGEPLEALSTQGLSPESDLLPKISSPPKRRFRRRDACHGDDDTSGFDPTAAASPDKGRSSSLVVTAGSSGAAKVVAGGDDGEERSMSLSLLGRRRPSPQKKWTTLRTRMNFASRFSMLRRSSFSSIGSRSSLDTSVMSNLADSVETESRVFPAGYPLDERRAVEVELIQKYDKLEIDPRGGVFWYLIDAGWMSGWVDFVMGNAGPPGPVTNYNLYAREGSRASKRADPVRTTPAKSQACGDSVRGSLRPSLRIKDGLQSGKHYRAIHPLVWFMFREIYSTDGAPEVCRWRARLYSDEVDASRKLRMSKDARNKVMSELQRSVLRAENGGSVPKLGDLGTIANAEDCAYAASLSSEQSLSTKKVGTGLRKRKSATITSLRKFASFSRKGAAKRTNKHSSASQSKKTLTQG